MATNPPTTIGELTDVPAPGSGVSSAWCQEVTRRSTHRFATIAARDAAYPAAGAGGGATCYTVAEKMFWWCNGAAWLPRPLAGGVLLTDAAQTIPTASVQDITWGTEVSDPDGWTAGGIAVLTVPAGKGGRYLMTFSGAWSGSATSSAAIVINGTSTYQGSDPATFNIISVSGLRTLAAGDTIKCSVIHTAGANRDIVSRLEIAPI